MKKSTLKEIEERFDTDVARFSNLETGQATTLDALYTMELITGCNTSLLSKPPQCAGYWLRRRQLYRKIIA